MPSFGTNSVPKEKGPSLGGTFCRLFFGSATTNLLIVAASANLAVTAVQGSPYGWVEGCAILCMLLVS